MTSGSRRSVICCFVNGKRNSALSQKPGGMTPASGSAAARRSISSSLISRNALLKGFGGGISSRLLYLTVRPRLLVVFAVIPARFPCRDDPDLAFSFSEHDPDHFAIVFSESNQTSLAVIASRVLGGQHIATEYFRSFPKTYAVLSLVGRGFGIIPFKFHCKFHCNVATKCGYSNISG